MSNVLDDSSEDQNGEEQLENVRVLALVFFAKYLAALFFRLRTEVFIIDVNYIWWIFAGMQLVAVQRALYAFYKWKDSRLLHYLRFFYISLGVLFLTAALLYSGSELGEEYASPHYLYNNSGLLLDTAVALLLIRYFFNRLESPQYWLFMEQLIQLCFGVILLYKVVYFVSFDYSIFFLVEQMNAIQLLFKALLVLSASICWLVTIKKIHPQNRVLTFLSLVAIVCWELGIYFNYDSRLTLELLLFAGTILAVLAYASSFSKAPKEEQ